MARPTKENEKQIEGRGSEKIMNAIAKIREVEHKAFYKAYKDRFIFNMF